MKKTLTYLSLFVMILFAVSCSKRPTSPVTPTGQTIIDIQDPNQLLFKIIPLSNGEAKILFLYPQDRSLVKLMLKKDSETIGTYIVNNDPNKNYYSVEIPYQFDKSVQYNFVVQTNPVNDTIYQYTIREYTHQFRDAYMYRKVLNLVQTLGPKGFDITPSRRYIFIADDSANTIITKKLSLLDYSTQTVSSTLYSLPVRAISDSSLLVQGVFFTNRPFGEDSATLVSYNTESEKTKFIGWVSTGYGRTSRVINNHVLITNPVFTSKTTSLVNLKNLSTITFPSSSVNFTQISENSFENIYNGNLIVAPFTGNFKSVLPANSHEKVEYTDNLTGIAIATGYTMPSESGQFSSHMSVYLDQTKVFQSDEVAGRMFYIPRLQSIKNNIILFYQYFGFDTEFNSDGYYTLDLNTGKITLLQSDNSSPFVIQDFQLDDRRIISVRYDGIYELLEK